MACLLNFGWKLASGLDLFSSGKCICRASLERACGFQLPLLPRISVERAPWGVICPVPYLRLRTLKLRTICSRSPGSLSLHLTLNPAEPFGSRKLTAPREGAEWWSGNLYLHVGATWGHLARSVSSGPDSLGLRAHALPDLIPGSVCSV